MPSTNRSPSRLIMACTVLVATISFAAYRIAVTSTPEPVSEDAAGPGIGRVETLRGNPPPIEQILHDFDLTDLSIPAGQITRLLPADRIPALTDPPTTPAQDVDFLLPSDRVVLVTIDSERLAVPLKVVAWHEIINTTLAETPIAVTYCPLCDSATVFDRRVPATDGSNETLDFAVSGALYNSNVLMYDRQYQGLWSQLAMASVSGRHTGTPLKHLPIHTTTLRQIAIDHPETPVVNFKTGHQRPYAQTAYAEYFANDRLLVDVPHTGTDFKKKKTPGVGVWHPTKSWFIPMSEIKTPITLTTPDGPVVIEATSAGPVVRQTPQSVRTAQTFYFSWSAFYPDTHVVGAQSNSGD